MKKSHIDFFRKLSYPFGWVYAMGVGIRNALFNGELIKSHTFKTAVISVGNITVGGTGKTPFVEYLIRLLKDAYKVSEVSRGYKRKTNGYQEASIDSSAATIGDEPYQIYRKFPDIKVIACADRCQAIRTIEKKYPETDVVILDDAYQHRYVNPGISILLIDYNRPVTEDKILPYGNLRESASGRYRADIVVVTKCPPSMNAFDAREVKNSLDLHAYQDLYFSTIKYAVPRRMVDGAALDKLAGKDVLLVTSVANPAPLVEYLERQECKVTHMGYDDHYKYTQKDIVSIERKFDAIESENKVVLVTAKDESKLVSLDTPDVFAQYLYVIDIEVGFLFDGEKEFSKKIVDYVEKNKRNSVLFAE